MTRVTKNTWTATLDRTLLLHILWESGVTLRDWSGVAAALGPGFSTTICENRYELLIKHVKLCLESVNEMPSSPGPMSLPMPSQAVPPMPGQSAQPSSQAHQTTENPEEEGAMWGSDEAGAEPPNHQPKSKKRKSNNQGGRASILVEIDEDEREDGQEMQEIDSEQLRTPHGQRTSNISFTRTNTVQKIFAPAAAKAAPITSAAKAPSGPAQQANTRRQQTQQQPSTQGPRNGNSHANYTNGNNTGTASSNVARGQSNNGRGRGRGRGGHGHCNMNRGNHRQNANTNNARN